MTVRDLQPRYSFLFDQESGQYSLDSRVEALVMPGFREFYVCFNLERCPGVFDKNIGYTWVPPFAVLVVCEVEL